MFSENLKPVQKVTEGIWGWITNVAVILLLLLQGWSCITPSIRQTQEQKKGDRLFQEHRYQEAITHYMQMLDASKKLGIYRNTSMESGVWHKIANCHEMTGKYEEATAAVLNAMALDSADRNTINLIEGFRHLGMISSYMGSYYRAKDLLEKSLQLGGGMENSIKSERRLAVAGTMLALGQIAAVTGRGDEALVYTDKALDIFRQAGNKRGEMESYLNIASVYHDAGDLISARKYTLNSLETARSAGMGTFRHNQLLASISMSSGEYEDALRYEESALAEAREFGIAGQIVWATFRLGDIYAMIGDLDIAEKYYREAKEVKDTLSINAGSLDASLGLRMGEIDEAGKFFSSQGSLTGKAISSYRMAELMALKNQTDSAIILLEQSESSFSESGNLQGVSNVRLLLGKLHIDRSEPDLASPVLDSVIRSAIFPETLWQAWFQQGRLLEYLNRPGEAIGAYRKSIEIIERIRGNLTVDEFKSAFFNSKREVYDRIINLLQKNGSVAEAFRYSEQARSRAFYDVLANRKIDFRGSLPGDLMTLEQEKRIEMNNLYKLLQKSDHSASGQGEPNGSDYEKIRIALAKAQSDYEDLLRRLKLNNPAYAEMVSAGTVTDNDVISKLDTATAMIAYWIGEKEVISWMITSKGIEGKIIPVSRKSLSEIIETSRIAIQFNNQNSATNSLSRLYEILIAPFGDRTAIYPNLVIIPNGPLHFLPFQALVDRNGEYLVQAQNILYSPSAGVYLICNDREVSVGKKFLGVALSDLQVENMQGLPGTRDELSNILPLFPENRAAFGYDATETFARKNAPESNYIHIATHGSYNYRQPLYSYLLFPHSDEDDGRLNVYEVFELNLNARLVALSACETGLGNLSQGDELIGLSRAFLFAGSSAVIVSLWAVADYPTSMLMSNFYRYLKDHSIQEALTLAQRDVIKIYPQPQYWSPFILIGNGSLKAE